MLRLNRIDGAPAKISALTAAIGALVVAAHGLRIFLADGSYFNGEASVVLSLDGMSALETFQGKLLGGGQNFPRFYLLAIRGVRELVGASTVATRLLPQVFFLAATLLWASLLFRRFKERPLLVLLGVLLLAAVPTWPLYGAAVKQYSFDTFCVLALFSLPERWLDDAFGEGRRRGRALWLLLPVALSFTYGVALLARILGWWVHRARRRGLSLDVTTAAMFTTGFAALSGLLWFTDLRHTMSQGGLFFFWQKCTLPASPSETVAILERFVLGFYQGQVEFVAEDLLAWPVQLALLGLLVLGVANILRATGPPPSTTAATAAAGWGSRSTGCLAGVVGVVGTSYVLDYPLCPGRLLLYVLWFQQMLLLEGADAVVRSAERLDAERGGRRLASGVALAGATALAVAIGARAVASTRDLALRTPVEDVRSQLAKLDSAPELPVLVTGCMERQVRTLPEGLGERDVRFQKLFGGSESLPQGQDFWVIHSLQFPGICQPIHEVFVALTTDAPKQRPKPGEAVLVYRTRALTLEELQPQARPGQLDSFNQRVENWRQVIEAVESQKRQTGEAKKQ